MLDDARSDRSGRSPPATSVGVEQRTLSGQDWTSWRSSASCGFLQQTMQKPSCTMTFKQNSRSLSKSGADPLRKQSRFAEVCRSRSGGSKSIDAVALMADLACLASVRLTMNVGDAPLCPCLCLRCVIAVVLEQMRSRVLHQSACLQLCLPAKEAGSSHQTISSCEHGWALGQDVLLPATYRCK